MIHGLDVARAILAVHSQFSLAAGSRWIVTDGRVYVLRVTKYLTNPLLSDMIGGTWPAHGVLVEKQVATKYPLDYRHR